MSRGSIKTIIVIIAIVAFLIYAGVDVGKVVTIGKGILTGFYDLLMALIVEPVQKLFGK